MASCTQRNAYNTSLITCISCLTGEGMTSFWAKKLNLLPLSRLMTKSLNAILLMQTGRKVKSMPRKAILSLRIN